MASSGLVGLVAVGGGTTGGVRSTRLCSWAIGKEGEEKASSEVLIRGMPQMKTSRLRRIQGGWADRIFRGAGGGLVGWAGEWQGRRGGGASCATRGRAPPKARKGRPRGSTRPTREGSRLGPLS